MPTVPVEQQGSAEAQAHIAAQTALQAIAVAGVAAAWDSLPHYDDANVPAFLARVVPLILAAQVQSVALTNAFLARVMRRPPLGLDVSQLTGAAIRRATPAVIQAAGLPMNATTVPPDVVYRRPFVDVWSALAKQTPWIDAVAAGRERATGTAAMDVQNAMRHTLRAVGESDDLILGYRRVPDADACPFCRLIAGRRYLTADLMEVHPRCRCGVDVITEANRGDFTGKRENDLAITRGGITAAVADHGELGALLVDGDHDFLQIAA